MSTVNHVKLKKNMGFGQIIAALFFLFNPDISIIDVLPDFIGYIILSVALSKIAMISESLYDAKRAFERFQFPLQKLPGVLNSRCPVRSCYR